MEIQAAIMLYQACNEICRKQITYGQLLMTITNDPWKRIGNCQSYAASVRKIAACIRVLTGNGLESWHRFVSNERLKAVRRKLSKH